VHKQKLWQLLALVEVIVAAAVVILDLFIPTIVLLGMIILSLLLRRAKLSTLGFKRDQRPLYMAGFVLLVIIVWSLLHLGLTMPVLNRLTGTTQDLSDFADLKGNLGGLLGFLALTWTIAAFGEEMAYRGYIQRRIRDVLGDGRLGVFAAIGVSSVLFGLAHREQGLIGVIVTFGDALVFSWLKRRFHDNLWASILAHGFSNTIGLVTFYFTGPLMACGEQLQVLIPCLH